MNTDKSILENGSKRVAIITGSNSGIGFETAKALALQGNHVIMACRNIVSAQHKADQIKSLDSRATITVLKCDLSDLDSIKEFAEIFKLKFTSLDLLINNAGVMGLPLTRSKQGFEQTFATNHLGHFALTGLLLERLQSTKGSRIVTLSSLAHRWGKIDFDNLSAEKSYSRDKVYAQSKLANLVFHHELSRRLKTKKIPVLAVAAHPGWTITNLQANTPLIRCLNPLLGQLPLAGALPTLAAAEEPEVESGSYFGPKGAFELKGAARLVKPSPASRDEAVGRRLWKVSEAMTGVRFLS